MDFQFQVCSNKQKKLSILTQNLSFIASYAIKSCKKTKLKFINFSVETLDLKKRAQQKAMEKMVELHKIDDRFVSASFG